MKMNHRVEVKRACALLAASVVAVGVSALGQTAGRSAAPAAPRPAAAPATKPAAGLPAGWEEIDQRLVFLTIQLSTIESTLDATNKALKSNGYQQAAKQAAADKARQSNETMDRNGGGPVPWQEFYGKTAEKFFYHPTDARTVNVTIVPIDQRPPQFDYIYLANEQNRRKAEEDAAKIGNKIEDLLDYRRQLEGEQFSLWCKIAFRGASSMELDSRPLYRLELTGGGTDDVGKQSLDALKAAIKFMRVVNAELLQAQKDLDGDQKGTLEHLSKATTAARTELQAKMLLAPALADRIADPRNALGQFMRSAKRLEDSSQNLVDAFRLAADSDGRDDVTSKLSYRGQLQQMVFDYASTLLTADQALTKAAAEAKAVPTIAKKVDAPVVEAAAGGVDGIPAKLDAARATREREMAAARRALVSAIDVRLNAAADAGDLEGVQSLQSVKLKAARDGSIPDDLKDDAILAARKQMLEAIDAANAKVTAAYRDAISSYTKARKITEAQSTLDELNALGITPGPGQIAGAGSAEPGPTASARSSAEATPAGGAGDVFTPPKLGEGVTEIELPAPGG